MKDSFSWLTPKQAGELAGYTARHIQNLIKSGKLTATREDGKYFIDKSEFFRVFPDAHRKAQRGNEANIEDAHARILSETEVKYLKEMLDDKDRQNEFLKKQLENFSLEKSMMLQAINSHSRLLEHKEEQKNPATPKKSWLDKLKPGR